MRAPTGKPGQHFGRYVLVEHIGGGGNADVWRADGPDGTVALKLLRSKNFSSDPYGRFVREVTQLRGLGALGGVLPLLDAHLPEPGSGERQAWLAMPLATPLREALAAADADVEAVVDAAAQVAETLAALAARGVSHRDVKPQNLYEHEGRVVVGDFGLVDAPGVDPLTSVGAAIGPVYFSAPELVRDASSAAGPPADVYSLAKTLWVLATQQHFPPPGEHRLDEASMLLRSYVTHPRAATLDALVARMTRHEPGERPAMSQVAVELRAWLSPSSEVRTSGVDLSELARRVALASEGARTEEEVLERRRGAVNDAMGWFTTRAEGIADRLAQAGLTWVTHTSNGEWGAFQTDAMPHLTEAVGLLATTAVLGGKPPVSMAGGLLVRRSRDGQPLPASVPDKLPGLKLWLGVADVQPAGEATFAAGAVIVYWSGSHSTLWLETRRAVLGGPRMGAVVADLVGMMNDRLGDDLAAWVEAVESSASTNA